MLWFFFFFFQSQNFLKPLLQMKENLVPDVTNWEQVSREIFNRDA